MTGMTAVNRFHVGELSSRRVHHAHLLPKLFFKGLSVFLLFYILLVIMMLTPGVW
jgi:hypothetical protein